MSIFSKKVIIITGASEGIGRALALALAPEQPKLVLAARNEPRLLSLAAECEQVGASACVVPTDVTDEQACHRLVEQTIEMFGALDILVNNAGISMRAKLEEVSDLSLFEYVMKVNFLSGVYCTKYALPYLKQSKGRVVAVTSVAGLTGVPSRTGYCASKHAMMGFFESLRMELEDAGVSVTIIAPDFVVSKIHERSFDAHGNQLDESPANQTYVFNGRVLRRDDQEGYGKTSAVADYFLARLLGSTCENHLSSFHRWYCEAGGRERDELTV